MAVAATAAVRNTFAQPTVLPPSAPARTVDTPVLSIGYEDSGDPNGFPVILLHGFPDDVRAWDGVAAALAKERYRVVVPYLRGYGPTRFRDPQAPRMAEQAAIGQDLIDFADALRLDRFAVSGYDWGGRAASIAAALHPERVRAALLIGGYSIQNTIDAGRPGDPRSERALWYQWYFNIERGRAGLAANRKALCRLLWETWSPGWRFTDAEYERTASSFDNPDFVDVVIHSYRHRLGNAPGEPRFTAVERQLARRPKITVPVTVLNGADDGLRTGPITDGDTSVFTSLVARRTVPGAGHFMPRERPDAVSASMLELLASAR